MLEVLELHKKPNGRVYSSLRGALGGIWGRVGTNVGCLTRPLHALADVARRYDDGDRLNGPCRVSLSVPNT